MNYPRLRALAFLLVLALPVGAAAQSPAATAAERPAATAAEMPAATAAKTAAAAAAKSPTAPDPRAAEAEAAEKNSLASAVPGPADIALRDQAHLHLTPGESWIPADPTRRLLRAWGNMPGPQTLGMVMGGTAGHHWTAVATYTQDGFVKDGDATHLNPADILAQLRDAADHDNEARRAQGFPALLLTGWLQPPKYDAKTHRLVWALQLHNAGSGLDDEQVNYNTRTLGREGFLSVNLLTTASQYAADKPQADALLNGLTYDPGKRYQDFNASTDHVAAYGLAALIGVAALNKLGVFALASAFLLKFGKLGAVAAVALVAGVRRVLRRRRANTV